MSISQYTNISSQRKHICYWVGCNMSFPNMMEIQTHLKNLHIEFLDKNANSFQCYWKDCNASGFESKHKLRHTDGGLRQQNQDFNRPTRPPQRYELFTNNQVDSSGKFNLQANEVIVIDDDESEKNSNSIHKEKSVHNINTTEEQKSTNDSKTSPTSNNMGESNNRQENEITQETKMQISKLQSTNGMSSKQPPLSSKRHTFRAVYPNETSIEFVNQSQTTNINLTNQQSNTLNQMSHTSLPSLMTKSLTSNPSTYNITTSNKTSNTSDDSHLEIIESILSGPSHSGSSFESLTIEQQNKKLLHIVSVQAQEIKKLKIKNAIQEELIKKAESDLEFQTKITKLLQDQNRRSDDKLRSMWVEMLCKKLRIREEEHISSKSFKRQKLEDQANSKDSNGRKDMDIDPWEKPLSPNTNISIITQAYICEWEGCGKSFRTKLALKAHVPSEHLYGSILHIKVDKISPGPTNTTNTNV
ncbi:4805_t:CDS:2 [Diversispora eburnea]|uniref:4805_t:CDS:1 n=1 Tax=Diversispora eburnea TaxID=1213867 RepID=A0A9N9GAR3_9GLOM|nr:4805_t:CDS:2 [Diversispora eburnea]